MWLSVLSQTRPLRQVTVDPVVTSVSTLDLAAVEQDFVHA